MKLKEIEKKIIPILKKYHATRAGFFGSFARGEQKRKSDVDILIELGSEWDLFDVIGIKLELEKAVKRKVDLVEYDTIRKEIKENVLKDEVPIRL